jgi:DNA (cytosine-5)-methyltransferase 1
LKVYYNDNNKKICHWLEKLIENNLIPNGVVDSRDIKEVKGSELVDFDQIHLFAGIGGWAYALQLANWPLEKKIMTGSCPCQPFSSANNNKKGFDDERHLWPEMFRIIKESKIDTIFGEQVAAKPGYAWLSRVQTNLEEEDFVVGICELAAGGFGAPHKRQRLFWVAHTRCDKEGLLQESRISNEENGVESSSEFGRTSTPEFLANTEFFRLRSKRLREIEEEARKSKETEEERERFRVDSGASDGLTLFPLGDADRNGFNGENPCLSERERTSREDSFTYKGHDYWAQYELATGWDGKTRRIKPGVRLLVDGLRNRLVKLSGLGNAIVPQVAAEFIKAYMEIENIT